MAACLTCAYLILSYFFIWEKKASIAVFSKITQNFVYCIFSVIYSEVVFMVIREMDRNISQCNCGTILFFFCIKKKKKIMLRQKKAFPLWSCQLNGAVTQTRLFNSWGHHLSLHTHTLYPETQFSDHTPSLQIRSLFVQTHHLYAHIGCTVVFCSAGP